MTSSMARGFGRFTPVALAAVIALGLPRAAVADSFPEKPIKLIVPFGPGGPPVYCPDEHLPVADIHEATKVYALFAALALAGDVDGDGQGPPWGGP